MLADLDSLAAIGGDGRGGVTRLAYTRADIEGRAWVVDRMLEMGMQARRDEALNVIGRYAGREPGLKPLALGSHTDTVPSGGRFDGSLGVVAALACVRALKAAGVQLRHAVEVIDFAAEEGTLGTGTLGSLAMTGRLDRSSMLRPAWDGRPAAEHILAAGLDPRGLNRCVRPRRCLAAYLELHVEQGALLEEAGLPIGVVEAIVGMRRYAVTFSGQANHAGTTPMEARQDALVMAAPFVTGVREAAIAAGVVGTVGVLRIQPGAANVIPGRVELEVDFRGPAESQLDLAESELRDRAGRQGGELSRTSARPPVPSDPRLMDAIEAACNRLGLSSRRMVSGAGHDAMVMGAHLPQAMVFVPSRGGISHSPEEKTEPEQCADGARVLLETLLELDDNLSPG